MNKRYAIFLFGGVQQMADALGVTRQATYKWGDTLNLYRTDQIVGACFRLEINMNPPVPSGTLIRG